MFVNIWLVLVSFSLLASADEVDELLKELFTTTSEKPKGQSLDELIAQLNKTEDRHGSSTSNTYNPNTSGNSGLPKEVAPPGVEKVSKRHDSLQFSEHF